MTLLPCFKMAMSSDFLSSSLTRQEKLYGAGWLAFETLLLSMLLQALNNLLPTPLPQAEVNFVFFCVNFTVVAIIFRRYLWSQVKLIPDLMGKIFFTVITGFMACSRFRPTPTVGTPFSWA